MTEVERLSARIATLEREKAAVEAFAAVAAHELLGPLILTESYADLVSERLAEAGQEESLRNLSAVSRAARRSRLLVETLLLDARSRGVAIERRPVDLNAVVRDVIAPLESEIQVRGATVSTEVLPVVHGDMPLIASVYANLLGNALKYGPRGRTIIRIGCHDAQGEVQLFVEANAAAIPAEDRDRIFEPFHRGRSEGHTSGVGLGLAICRTLVERHGGRIWVDPQPGDGNRFSFTLPA